MGPCRNHWQGNFESMLNLARYNYLLFTFCLILDFTILPAIYTCTVYTLTIVTDYHVQNISPRPGGSVMRVSDSLPDGCEFETRLGRNFFPAYFLLSPLLKHVKSCRWLWKEIRVSTGVRKSGNTCASPSVMI